MPIPKSSSCLFLPVLLALRAYGAGAPPSAKPYYVAPRSTLDTALAHKLYMEAEFEEATDKLETALKYVRPLSHEDSVFIFKHLGVMYTSKYETRETGKKYMMLLLQTEPTARIMDMYASDMIYMIFKNIQDEFDLAQMKLRRAQALKDASGSSGTNPDGGAPSKTPSPRGSSIGKSGHAWVWWTVGAATMAAGVGFYFWTQRQDDAKPARNLVPGQGT